METTSILSQIRQEFSMGDNYISPKRKQIVKRLEKHIKQNKES
jgi:hypothetical protein